MNLISIQLNIDSGSCKSLTRGWKLAVHLNKFILLNSTESIDVFSPHTPPPFPSPPLYK